VSVPAADGTQVVGSDRALHFGDGETLAWHQVDQARWLEATNTLEVLTLPSDLEPARTHRVTIPVPGRLPELVRERVTSSIVVSERLTLSTATARSVGVRIVARRVPDGDGVQANGGVRWSVIYDDGAPRSDPLLQSAAREAVAALQTRLGV